MGRRKIEIQPITHERNRSVTFLKRKNGLFKKAYELGVLCSVDVAVIIFEERPGHHLKLYQYCSTDIHEIVQRHLRHDGEKDTRGPQDFSGNANTKIDDGADGEDDDADEDDDAGKRRSDPKLKRSTDLTMSTDLDFISHQRGLSIPQPPLPMHGMAQGSSLPISSDRHGLRNHPPSSHPSKRPRTDHPSIHSRSPSDDHLPSGSAAYHYQSGSAGTFARTGGQYHHSGGGSQYTPLYPVSTHTPPPPGFIPLQQEFSSSRGPPPRSATGPPPAPFSAARSSSSGSSYDANMYSNMMRPPSGSHHPSGGGGSDLFSAFLDADEHSRQSQSQGFGLDWPVHGSNPNSAPPGPAAAAPVPNPTTATSGPEGGNNWLDFLSGSANTASSGRDPSMSWERSGGDNRADMVDMFGSGTGGGSGGGGGGGSGVQTASPLGVGIGGMAGKRGRVGSEVEDTNAVSALGGSPGSVNGIGNDKKDMKAEGGG